MQAKSASSPCTTCVSSYQNGSVLRLNPRTKTMPAILGIELLDHIIFERSAYFSFLESGLL